ncbi:MAG: deoxyribodipyrimidine photo-lyase [Bacteroidia bacterium]|nr:DNA photolyase family protein [Bacteroidia bacterium]MDW8159498.1 deoxyribodipyrimidine photo-lyase [Bacteroidia bacterium]
MTDSIAIHWFRRDLRLEDNASLYYALKSGYPVLPIFIYDTNILDPLPREDRRVVFIHQTVANLKKQLQQLGSDLLVLVGKPVECYQQLLQNFQIAQVYTNKDYEPYAIERDLQVKEVLQKHNICFFSYKDHVVFEHPEVETVEGKPYTVYTPYKNRWLQVLNSFYYKAYPTLKYRSQFWKQEGTAFKYPSLSELGFKEISCEVRAPNLSKDLLLNYAERRDYPALNSTSNLSVHLRFGTISVREVVRQALRVESHAFLNEIIWRDFFSMILSQFPRVVTEAFKPAYEKISWRNNENEFQRWCEGRTGYPLVDAGMRELAATGYMHNRVRMVAASFLTKHLLIDWRWGEAHFAQLLMDYDLASNNGNWQWAAGCGCDAAPYFRIFNPVEQAKKFDPDGEYIKKWVPEYGTLKYPLPIVEHAFARKRALETFKKALSFN